MRDNLKDLKSELTDCSNFFCKEDSVDTQNGIKSLGDTLFDKFKKYSIKKR